MPDHCTILWTSECHAVLVVGHFLETVLVLWQQKRILLDSCQSAGPGFRPGAPLHSAGVSEGHLAQNGGNAAGSAAAPAAGPAWFSFIYTAERSQLGSANRPRLVGSQRGNGSIYGCPGNWQQLLQLWDMIYDQRTVLIKQNKNISTASLSGESLEQIEPAGRSYWCDVQEPSDSFETALYPERQGCCLS